MIDEAIDNDLLNELYIEVEEEPDEVDAEVALIESGDPMAPMEFGPSDTDPSDLARIVQQVYLGVGKVLSADEARDIVNAAGGNLTGSFTPDTVSQ